MEPIRIDDPDDGRVAAYRDIRERDLVGRQGRFVAEGKVVLDVLLGSGRFEPESVLILENRLDGLGEVLRKLPAHVPVYVASRTVMDSIAGFPMHRGVLAIGLKGQAPAPQDLLAALPARALVLVLVGIANHDNIGSIFRNAAAFGRRRGLHRRHCCDPLYRRRPRFGGRGAESALRRLRGGRPFHRSAGAAGFRAICAVARGRIDLVRRRTPSGSHLYLGTEGEGLPDALLSRLEFIAHRHGRGLRQPERRRRLGRSRSTISTPPPSDAEGLPAPDRNAFQRVHGNPFSLFKHRIF